MSHAARVGDPHTCPKVDPGPKPHGGGPILPPGTPAIRAGGQPKARVGDSLVCVGGPPDFIVTGSATVRINGKPVARVGDKTMHGGTLTAGCSNVRTGGATVGGTLGHPEAGQKAFEAAALGRSTGALQQSYQNCGVESTRQIIHQATGRQIGEDLLLDRAMERGWAERDPVRIESGGTLSEGRKEILAAGGVESTLQLQTMENIQQAVAERKGVITAHDAGKLWGTGDSGGHAVVVTGIKYNANGKPEAVYINDTGSGIGKDVIPAERFEKSLLNGRQIKVTSSPIWTE